MRNVEGVNSVKPVKPAIEKPEIKSQVANKKEGASFKDMLIEAVSEVQKLQEEADATIKQLVSGEIKDVSEVMIAVQRADTAFQTLMAVRNKVITAYEEIMRMQI